VEAEPFEMPIATAQPILLAVNELVVNALRHAFPNAARGEIHVTVAKMPGELRIGVTDNGPGLPPQLRQGRGYGMNLVKMMTAKIGGFLHVENSGGAKFVIAAPIAAIREPVD
jgi:two-component sensor histidine kinase